MRVTHLARFDCLGGAARSAYRLHQGLKQLGIQSRMLVEKKSSTDTDVIEAEPLDRENLQLRRLAWVEEHYVRQNRSELSNTYYSLNEPGYDLAEHPVVREADVLNLHWVAGYMSPRGLGELKRLGKPIVWTLHDQRPCTGGCHFSAGCLKYERNCRDCPQLRSDPARIAKHQLRDAIVYGQPDMIVCPSQWMARIARKSRRFRDVSSRVIPYGIDTTLFRPQSRELLRKKFQMEPNAVYLMFGADNSNEKHKGFHHLIEALNRCADEPEMKTEIREKRLALLCLGHASPRLNEIALPVTSVGYMSSEEEVSALYAASNIFVLPSLEDNLPNTIIEAMSSGLPVVAFDCGGVGDLVQDGRSGRLLAVGDAAGMAEALRNLFFNRKQRESFGMNGRAIIEHAFTLQAQASAYIRLYRELTSTRERGSQGGPNAKPQVYARFGRGFARAYRDIATGTLPRHVQAAQPFPELEGSTRWQRVPLRARLWFECFGPAHRRRRAALEQQSKTTTP